MSSRKLAQDLRSHRWLGPDDMRSFGHRSRLRQIGYDAEDWTGKPVIGIINTWSEINPCHAHLRERAENVKRGVLQAGGFPIELPAMSLAETFVKPTTMLYRNMLAMETEELLRSHPIDGAVLMGGCDKTTPGLIMGAISMGIPAIYVPAGPMLRGNWKGEYLGSGSDVWKYWTEKRAGNITDERVERDRRRHRAFVRHLHGDGHGGDHDGDRRSARPVAAGRVVDPGRRFQPFAHVRRRRPPHRRHGVGRLDAAEDPDARRLRQRHQGAHGDGRLDQRHHPCGGDGAPRRHAGGHGDVRRLSRQVPVLANVRPSGKYLMEDFFYAGGLRALMQNLREKLDLTCLTVTGKSVGENIEGAKVHLPDVIHSLNDPVYAEGATAVLKGNLAPNGCVIKPAAADKRFLKHRGKAIAFEDYNHMMREIERDDLDVTPDHILVLKNAGPKGGPGMPEWGMLPIPKRLLGQGVRDMIRISDARMSGTSYGACILHVAPESFVGGPLALVKTGDEIEIDVDKRSIHLHVSDEELARRRAAWKAPPPKYPRGYGALFSEHIGQADEGCDFDFLSARGTIPEPEIH